jgi:hypothetical protein
VAEAVEVAIKRHKWQAEQAAAVRVLAKDWAIHRLERQTQAVAAERAAREQGRNSGAQMVDQVLSFFVILTHARSLLDQA